MKAGVLYVDDEANNLQSFVANYRRYYNIFITTSVDEAREILKTEDILVVVSDQRMPKTTGVEFLESIIEPHPHIIRIILTGYTDVDAVIDCINKGQVYRYVQKPWNEQDFRITLDKAIELYNLRKENRELTEKLLVANQQLEFIARQNLLS